MGGTAFLYNELVDMVIDHLYDDKRSLTSCSLVSRTWLNSSQFHLFESMRLPGVTAADGVEAFMKLVDSCPRIGCYVRSLRVDGGRDKRGRASEKDMLTPRHMRFFMERLPALRELLLIDVVWDSPRDALSFAAPTASHPLNKLVLYHDTSLRSLVLEDEAHHGIFAQDMLDILSYCSDIRELHFATQQFDVDCPPHASLSIPERVARLRLPTRPIRVGSLIVDSNAHESQCCAATFAVFNRICDTSTVHTFKAKVRPGDLQAVARFVSARGKEIRHYHLDLSAYFTLERLSAHETFSLLSLADCPNLETFELLTPVSPPERLWTYILVALSSLPPTTRHITIHAYLDGTVLESLASACSGAHSGDLSFLEQFTQLETLEFALRHPYGHDPAYPWRLDKYRGMLKAAVPSDLQGKMRVKPCRCLESQIIGRRCHFALRDDSIF